MACALRCYGNGFIEREAGIFFHQLTITQCATMIVAIARTQRQVLFRLGKVRLTSLSSEIVRFNVVHTIV